MFQFVVVLYRMHTIALRVEGELGQLETPTMITMTFYFYSLHEDMKNIVN